MKAPVHAPVTVAHADVQTRRSKLRINAGIFMAFIGVPPDDVAAAVAVVYLATVFAILIDSKNVRAKLEM